MKCEAGEAEEEGAPSWSAARLIDMGAYGRGLPSAAARRLDLCTCLQDVRCLHRGLNWVQSCIPSRWAQQPLSQGHILDWLRLQNMGALTSMETREGEELPIVLQQ